MAIMIEKKPSLRYLRDIFFLPYDTNKPMDGYLLIPLIKDISNLIQMITENGLVSNTVKYQKLFHPMKYTDKIFTKSIKYTLNSDERLELTAFAKNVRMQLVDKVSNVKKKNTILDTSILHKNFIDYSAGKNYLKICESYVNHLNHYLNKVCRGLEHEHKYIMLNSMVWDISSNNAAKVLSLNSKLINPITILFTLSKKKSEMLDFFDGYTFIIEDGNKGWFWFNGSELKNEDFFTKFRSLLQKFKHPVIVPEHDEEDDEEKKLAAGSAAEMIRSADSMSAHNEDEDEETDTTDEEPEETNDEEELARIEEEIKENFNLVSKSMPDNKRLEELRKKQAKVKIENLSLNDIKDDKALSGVEIETVDISDKIFTPSESVKKIRFDNFNKSYNKHQKEKDIISIFKSLNNKTNPVFVTKIEKKDSSTPMDLKETYTVHLEGVDRSRHTLTFDLPKVYDDNYIFIGGNRKQFVNQQFLKPIVKIAPDTVQICTNYNKIFMKRYGDENVSPEVQMFKKIVLNHPEEFDVVSGNGAKLSNGHKTSIEYDGLAKSFLKVTIKKDKSSLIFDQKYFDKLVEEKKLEAITDDWLYCFRINDKITIPCNIEEDMSVYNDTEEDKKEKNISPSVVSIFTSHYEKVTGKNFWDLEPSLKPGKRFMYSRCTVMAKKIPTVIFLSYFEGLTTVMRKAGVVNYFSDKRPTVDPRKYCVLQFSDGYLVYERYPTKISMLMNGLSVIDTKAYKYSDFDDKAVYLDIFEVLFNSRIIASGLDSFYDNMIDPVTEEVLVQMDLPTDFVSLVLVANNLLSDNNYTSEISAENYRIRSNEMIYAYAYKAIANAYSKYKRYASNKTPVKISIPRNEIIKEIITSNIMEDVSIINPITEKEKLHSMTCKGPSGINVDRAYTKEKRCFHKTMTGFSAMSTSPDGNCGVVREMTMEPKVINTRGFIDTKKSLDEMKDVNLFSYAEMLTPMGVNVDDSIRVLLTEGARLHE